MKYTDEDIERIRQLIAGGESQQALDALFALTANDERVEDDLVLLDSRYAHLQKSILEGTIARDDEIIERNTINRSLLALLKIIEKGEEPETYSSPKAEPLASAPPVPDKPALERFRQFRRPLLLIAGLFILLLSAWGIGKWIIFPANSPKPEARNLTARLVLRPDRFKLPDGVEARLQIGQHLTAFLPVPEDGLLHFDSVWIKNSGAPTRLLISGLRYPGKVVEQSAPNFARANAITFVYELELIELKGRVIYPDNKPARGIELVLDGGLARAETDQNGAFTLQVPRIDKKRLDVEFWKNGKVVRERTLGFYQQVFKELKIPY